MARYRFEMQPMCSAISALRRPLVLALSPGSVLTVNRLVVIRLAVIHLLKPLSLGRCRRWSNTSWASWLQERFIWTCLSQVLVLAWSR